MTSRLKRKGAAKETGYAPLTEKQKRHLSRFKQRPRPSASDRDVADALYRLPAGEYTLSVRADNPHQMQFLHLAELKTEGMLVFDWGGRHVAIRPRREAT
jgi:hypothetical protein